MPYGPHGPPVFKGPISNGNTEYVGIPVPDDGRVGIHIAWKDATSDATITYETSAFSAEVAPVNEAGSAWEWVDESSDVPITGPAGSAAGAESVHAKNVNLRRARLKIVADADCDLEIYARR